MFDSIDQKIISLFQWAVRQCELYSFINRKIILLKALQCLMYVGLSACAVCVLIPFYGYNISIMTLCISMWGYWMFNFGYDHRNYIKNETVSSMQILPAEIVSRKIFRLIDFFILIYLTSGLFAAYIFQFETINKIVIILVLVIHLLVQSIEYLLCTTSLPPGEKQKQQEKREMKHFTPQRIKN